MRYCSESVSRKLRILSFAATVSVVVVHTNYLEGYVGVPFAWWVGNAIGYMQRWAVPFFFMVSGFFFERSFRGAPVLSHWKPFAAKKARSILVPYLLWGIAYGVVSMTLLKAGVAYTRGEADLFAGTVFAQWGGWAFFDSLLGVTHAPLIGALWYLRVLLMVFFTAPLWIGLLRLSRLAVAAAALAIVLWSPVSGMYEEAFQLPGGVLFRIKVNALGWLLAGMAAGAFDLERASVRLGAAALYGALWTASALLPLGWEFAGAPVPTAVYAAHQMHPLFAAAALWGLCDVVSPRLPGKLPVVFGMGFWIYCMHHPVTGFVGAAGNLVLGRSLAARCAMQPVGWAITLATCIGAAFLARRACPRAYAVLCGGRTE